MVSPRSRPVSEPGANGSAKTGGPDIGSCRRVVDDEIDDAEGLGDTYESTEGEQMRPASVEAPANDESLRQQGTSGHASHGAGQIQPYVVTIGASQVG